MSKKEVVLLTESESLERLLYRLPADHPQRKFLEVELYRRAAGKRGEDRLKRKFVEFDLDESHQFLRNISLSIGEWKVQIDGLLLTERGAIVIESKNISGKLHFDEATGEFSRVDSDGIRTVMEDPTIQLNKHMRFLAKFFKLKEIALPINGLVVFTSKQCEFISKPKNNYVCKTYQMIDYLFNILQTFPPKVTRQDLSTIDKLLQQHHTPYKRNPLCRQYFIDANDLLTGILCANCKKHSVIRKHKTGWICLECQKADEMAIHYAVQEYFSLIDDQLNNKRLREFCNLDSPYTASRILAAFDFEVSGALKNRTYELKKKG
jgi:hypothetical protein